MPSAFSQRHRSEAVRLAAASIATTSSSGITARSWNSSTANDAWPPGVCSRFFSPSVARPIAVDDMATPMPATRPIASGWPSASGDRRHRGDGGHDLHAAEAEDRAAQRPHALRRSSSSPIRNSSSTTPNSANSSTVFGSAIRPQSPRADRDAGDQVAEHRAEAEALEQRHRDHAGGEVDQRLLQKAVVSM